jgi:hypothetical protein
MDEPTYLLLPVTSREIDVVVDALVAFATQCEADGDICGAAPIADAACERARQLRDLSDVAIEQAIRMSGLGRHRHRPQG